MQKKHLWLSLVLTLAVIAAMIGCATPDATTTPESTSAVTDDSSAQAKYVFLFIGDGMGVAQRNAAELYLAATSDVERPEDVQLLMNTFPAQGMNTTYDLTSVIPDSASTATAIATGYKTTSGTIGMNADGTESYETITEIAKKAGWEVGVISTVSIDHATPAAFYAHEPSRSNYYNIDLTLANSDFDYFAGGGVKREFGDDGSQSSVIELAEQNGYTVADTIEEFNAISADDEKVWAINPVLDADKAMPFDILNEENSLTLADFVSKGIEVLDNETGFIMVVEGGKIDWACHANDAAASIGDTLALDDAINVAYQFYLEHPDETLIIATADHETGGMTIGYAGTQYSTFFDKIQYQTSTYDTFGTVLDAYKENHTPENADLNDLADEIEAAFGLKIISAEERASLTAQAEAGDADAETTLSMALTELELAEVQAGFEQSMLDEELRAADDYTYLLYGGYDPLTMKLTTILNQKAGIAWTSYSHTGIPVQTSAIGVGADLFNGYYDQTDIFYTMTDIAGL